jgi:hypothetical protein
MYVYWSRSLNSAHTLYDRREVGPVHRLRAGTARVNDNRSGLFVGARCKRERKGGSQDSGDPALPQRASTHRRGPDL